MKQRKTSIKLRDIGEKCRKFAGSDRTSGPCSRVSGSSSTMQARSFPPKLYSGVTKNCVSLKCLMSYRRLFFIMSLQGIECQNNDKSYVLNSLKPTSILYSCRNSIVNINRTFFVADGTQMIRLAARTEVRQSAIRTKIRICGLKSRICGVIWGFSV